MHISSNTHGILNDRLYARKYQKIPNKWNHTEYIPRPMILNYKSTIKRYLKNTQISGN